MKSVLLKLLLCIGFAMVGTYVHAGGRYTCEKPHPNMEIPPGGYDIWVVREPENARFQEMLQDTFTQIRSERPTVFGGVDIKFIPVKTGESLGADAANLAALAVGVTQEAEPARSAVVFVSNDPDGDLLRAKAAYPGMKVVVVPSPANEAAQAFRREQGLSEEAYLKRMALHAALGSVLYFNGQRSGESFVISFKHSLMDPK